MLGTHHPLIRVNKGAAPPIATNVKLRGAPTLKPEQRAYRDETRHLEMPRQGVSLLNAMLGFFFFSACFFFSQLLGANTHVDVTRNGVTRKAWEVPRLASRRKAWRKRKGRQRRVCPQPLPAKKPAKARKGEGCRTLSRKRLSTQRSEIFPRPLHVLSGRDHWPETDGNT